MLHCTLIWMHSTAVLVHEVFYVGLWFNTQLNRWMADFPCVLFSSFSLLFMTSVGSVARLTSPHWCVCVELVHFLRQSFHHCVRWQCTLWCGDPLPDASQFSAGSSSLIRNTHVSKFTLNSKEWLIHSKTLELFLRLALWKQMENNFFLLVLTALPVRHQLGKCCT